MGWFDEGSKRQHRRRAFLAIVLLWVISATYARLKPLPAGVRVASEVYTVPALDVRLLTDVTGVDAAGNRVSEQEIFDAILAIIRGAEHFVVMDFFLFNEYRGREQQFHRDLTKELTDALVAKRTSHPQVPIWFITDPINTVYGGLPSPELNRLRQAGVTVITTDLTKLRDSNSLYAGFWRPAVRWFGNSQNGGWIANPFDASSKVSLRSWLALLNFKANHRKVVIADRGNDIVSLVTSFNPHTASSGHSNLAIEFINGPWRELIASEQAVAAFSNARFDVLTRGLGTATSTATSTLGLQVVTEGSIPAALLQQLATAASGDQVDALVFYLSDRKIINALVEAALRGASVRVILDPNKDAFGQRKDGTPNRPVATELMLHANIRIRWYDTHGEQAHSKLLLIRKRDGAASLVTGSANWTKRNLQDMNLETNVVVSGDATAEPLRRAGELFERLWANRDKNFTVDYPAYRDASLFKSLRYRYMEWSGLSSW